MRLLGRFAGLLGLATAILVAPAAAPALANPIGSCSTTVGTIVAVDFAHWGGPIVRGCGIGDSSDYALLHAAGFSTAGDRHDGPAFICRLGNAAFAGGTQYPTPAQDPCVVTPPATAYWTYWLALAGQSRWSYSQGGATSQTPKPGEVELWTFGGSGTPTVSPAALRAHNTSTPKPTRTPSPSHSTSHAAAHPSHPTATPAPHSSSSSAHASASSTASARSSTTASPRATTAATGTPPASTAVTPPASSVGSSAPSTVAAASSGQPAVVNAQPAAKVASSSGSAVPLAVGLALVVVLGGGAAWTIRRRRGIE